jgi:hypothetical protein
MDIANAGDMDDTRLACSDCCRAAACCAAAADKPFLRTPAVMPTTVSSARSRRSTSSR